MSNFLFEMLAWNKATTPKTITPEIYKFCAQLVPEGQAQFIPVQPSSLVKFGECFFGVQDYVRHFGGEMVCGWMIWADRFLLDAEFHGVWRDRAGDLYDLTPKPDGETRILFLADPHARFDGRPRMNVVYPLSKHPLVKKLAEVNTAMNRLRLERWGQPMLASEVVPFQAQLIAIYRRLYHDEQDGNRKDNRKRKKAERKRKKH